MSRERAAASGLGVKSGCMASIWGGVNAFEMNPQALGNVFGSDNGIKDVTPKSPNVLQVVSD
jgi:hypothetical protein